MEPSYTYRARVTKVVDGDTFCAVVDLGFAISAGNERKPMTFRLAGVDVYETTLRAGTTPEQKAKGQAAKLWLTERLLGKDVVVESTKADGEDAKFGRYLARVYEDGACVNDLLKSLGYTK